jgi:hypothetical protein
MVIGYTPIPCAVLYAVSRCGVNTKTQVRLSGFI